MINIHTMKSYKPASFTLIHIQFEANPIDSHDFMRVTLYSFTWLRILPIFSSLCFELVC